MKNLSWLSFLLILVMMATSCGSDVDDDLLPTVDVEINMKGTFGDELLLMRKDYQFNDSVTVRFDRVSFYVSDVVLLKDVEGPGDEETGVFDLELFDYTSFTEMNPGTADQGISFVGTNIPVDNYKGLKIGLGVPADLNRLSPDNQSFGDGHPLTNSVHYWQGWQSYMFVMVEGVVDLNGDGDYDVDDESFQYHLGKDEAYQSSFILNDISFTENANPKLEVKFDVKKMFMNNDGSWIFDLTPKSNRATHNPDNFPFIQEVMVYFSRIFTF